METLRKCASALSQWTYTLMQVKIPLLNVSLWLFCLALFTLRMLFKVTDTATHRSQGSGQDYNNNKVYREE